MGKWFFQLFVKSFVECWSEKHKNIKNNDFIWCSEQFPGEKIFRSIRVLLQELLPGPCSWIFVFLFLVAVDSHFPFFCSRDGIFYKPLVASGNSAGTPPVIPARWGRRVRRGPSLPHAPGSRMTVVHRNSFKQICTARTWGKCLLYNLIDLAAS